MSKVSIEWSGRVYEVDPEQRVFIGEGDGIKYAVMYIPGYDELVMIQVAAENGPVWHWNGDIYDPTFSPSILSRFPYDMERKVKRNHVFVRAGKIQYLPDCSHDLAGKTIELPRLKDWPGDLRLWSK